MMPVSLFPWEMTLKNPLAHQLQPIRPGSSGRERKLANLIHFQADQIDSKGSQQGQEDNGWLLWSVLCVCGTVLNLFELLGSFIFHNHSYPHFVDKGTGGQRVEMICLGSSSQKGIKPGFGSRSSFSPLLGCAEGWDMTQCYTRVPAAAVNQQY